MCIDVQGCLPESLCALPYLTVLDLRQNQLSGSIPDAIGGVAD
jgi:hypothetical protein